ncbi:YceG family protein [Clostridium lundense]|uniref:YceG family protein n=1 Tax=Clostridium lundense TaxID=319475 RepID=UPI000484D95C|nr:YceG family protein [Clostridium lundense]
MSIIKANNIYEDIFKTLSLREGNYFCRVIGVRNEQDYNNTIAFLDSKLKELDNESIIFTSTIPNPYNEDLVRSIMDKLDKINVNNIGNEYIDIVSCNETNEKMAKALSILIPIAIQNEAFQNKTIRNNFITKLMIWTNEYVEDIQWQEDVSPKCLYYGKIKKYEGYFLMLLALMGFDVLYLNPQKDSIFQAIDKKEFSQLIEEEESGEIIDYYTRVSSGAVIEKVTTYAKQASQELDKTLYNGTGIYKPWQYINGFTKPVIMNSIIEDMLTYWDEPSRLRPGFRTEKDLVYTPIFFNKVSGVYSNLSEYIDVVNSLRKVRFSIFVESTNLSNKDYNNQELYSLAFCLNRDKSINKEALKSHEMFGRLKILRSELQDFIIDKIDETLCQKRLFNFDIDDKKILKLIISVLLLDDNVLTLIDCYDYTASIPKIIIYLKNRETFEDEDALLLGLLHRIGLDIVILTPNGTDNIELKVSTDYLNVIRLEDIAFDLDLDKKNKRKSFFEKLFG